MKRKKNSDSDVTDRLQNRLAQFRKLLVCRTIIEGSLFFVAVMLWVSTVIVLIEAVFYFSSFWRLMILVFATLLSIFLAARRIICHLKPLLNFHRFVLSIESKYPELQQRLITAIELNRNPEAHDFYSSSLFNATVEGAEKYISSINSCDLFSHIRVTVALRYVVISLVVPFFLLIWSNDVIVDCGANVGELNLALALRGVDIHYIGFEPDEETFKCLELNNKNMNSDLYNLALSNISGESNLYLDNEGGNSSLVDFGTESNVIVETRTLDSFNFEKIKLLKIDAEGFEPEVLEGAKESLENIEFISIDFGGERGPEQKKTIVSVNRFLYKNDYQLIEFSDYRFIGLYKNNRI